ncbi:hypothetical protein FRB95_003255 [Tulasnella sp. JGI-2019a]|nr:hypothetical protein FRB95_003255 [Tulasnella sp. JGI-2019a]
MVFCALAELLGWAGRYWSSQNYRALTPFLMQICCTIMAPSFMAAGMFFILGMIVNRVGQEYSRLRPKVFSIVFISFDFFSLVVQAIGGGAASSSFQKGKSATKGTNIMVTGIFIQLVAISLAVVVAIEFLIRYLWDKPLRARTTPERTLMGHNEKLMLSGLAIATMWLYIRTIYRTIELLGGWQGAVIHNQAAFDCLDAMPVIIALVTLSILSPGRLLSAPKLDRQSINNEGVPMHHVAMGKSIGDLK